MYTGLSETNRCGSIMNEKTGLVSKRLDLQ